MSIRDSLGELGLTLPPAQVVPEGMTLTYRRLVRWGDVVYVAGHGPTWGDGWGSPLGKVGQEVSIEEGVAAAELTALNVLATIERELGNLDQVACWLKINGYVNAVPGFTEQARVVNGFSDLILKLYGLDKLSARTSVGVPDLPFGMPVEVDAVLAWGGT
jgi:enamine deaminase RidA (YjgF/YER057c/UK114 family)